MSNSPRTTTAARDGDSNFCYTSIKDNQQLPTVLVEKKANGTVLELALTGPPNPNPRSPKSQVPPVPAILPSHTRRIPGTGEEIFFPKPAHRDAVYEIEITGVLEYHFFRRAFWSGERLEGWKPMKADAYHSANAAGRFEHPHEWLRVNGKPLALQSRLHFSESCYRQAEKLEAERGSHTYRFLVDDPGECVGIAFDARWAGEHTRAMTLEHVWDAEADPFSNTVDVHVRFLRHKVDAGFRRKLLKTVHGYGYKFAAASGG